MFLHDYELVFVLRVKLVHGAQVSFTSKLGGPTVLLRECVCVWTQNSDNASFLIVSFYSTGALSSCRKHCFRVGVARLSGVELPGF